jgi:hypothetical protein
MTHSTETTGVMPPLTQEAGRCDDDDGGDVVIARRNHAMDPQVEGRSG